MIKKISAFLKSTSGNFGVMLGLTLTPIAMSLGVAIDYSAYKNMESRMVVAAEAAMLAGSKEVVRVREQDYADNGEYDMTNAQVVAKLDEVFKPFFEANFAAGGYELSEDQYTLEYIEADNNTKLRITMRYDTAVMNAFGKEYLTASKDMIINLKVQPKNYVIDIVMCIDATGSMQNTLDAVQANAMTFNDDLREELGIGRLSKKVKIRVRPIFYRDWEEGRAYQNAMAQYEEDLEAWEEYNSGGGSGGWTSSEWDDFRDDMIDDWNDSDWYYQKRGSWKRATKKKHPKTHKRVKVRDTSGSFARTYYYYFSSLAELNAWIDDLEDGDITVAGVGGTGSGPGTPVEEPTKPINHGLNMYEDFIDLDPVASESDDRDDRNLELNDFLDSTYAFGGNDWPEAAGACLNEAVRSNWYDNQSADSREYFEIPNNHVIVKENDPVPEQTYTKVTPIPVIVFWSDATINSRFDLAQQYLSPTHPSNYTGLESVWNDADKIDQAYKMMIRFGPSSATGWNTIKNWDRTYYGGSLSTGNDDAVKVIAKKVLEAIPDLLRIGS